MSRDRRKRRVSRRKRQQTDSKSPDIAKITQPVHKLPTFELLNEEGLEQIHNASLEILSDVGIDFYDDEAQTILKQHGVRLEGDTAFFDREMIADYVAKAPSQFTQIARNSDRHVLIGGNHICFAPVYGPPFVYNMDRGRREATLEDFRNFIKLTYLSPWLHHSGGTIVEPTDEPTHTRHLDMVYSHIKYSDKPFMGSVTSAENAADSVRMAEILFGAERLAEETAVVGLINISSPRRLDDRMLGALKVYAKARQALIITPFIFSGAMAPVGIAGTLVQLNAEALAGIVFTQMVNPGTPVVYGAFQTNIDLQSGAPVFGSPESQLTLYAAGQLARRHGLPYRSGGMFTSSKIPDAQAAYESVMVMLPAVQARVNFVLHAAGWLEGGLAAGYEKFVMDNELLGMYHKFIQGLDLSENGMAMDALRTVPTDGHHLGTPHTIQNFREAFHRSDFFDYNSFEQWRDEGGKTATEKANGRYKQLLRQYQPPPLDPATDEALQAFMTKRKEEIKPEY
ncbi:trimethylamine methyltransferase family protein [Candidatus Leptofilum sp.]|uniref:trimethylamine methyltransferase family protein n=1 Tax=Candidatus Leptofilum sp. TaxID=3241576 RepID=UPI003B59F59F